MNLHVAVKYNIMPLKQIMSHRYNTVLLLARECER